MSRNMPFAVILAAILLYGCGSPKPVRPRVEVTIGQQLIELKEAHDAGALNDKEYDRQRKKLIDSFE
ncbi:MAG TPA: SHOCT domain-containing protein [Burkholderiales bacterium]|nr:SHOCT domain-containing protein [Burkholderiales bacterium]